MNAKNISKNDLNHMVNMLEDVKRIIKEHKDLFIDISEFEPKYIEESFNNLEFITGKLGGIISELLRHNI